MKLSVIIPCKNEEKTVRYLLDTLVLQEVKADEIIVIDSHSTDTTAQVVLDYYDRLPISLITAKKRGLAAARNEGAAQASGDTLLFIDADVRLPRNFIRQLTIQTMKRPLQVGGFSQRMLSKNRGIRIGARCMNAYVRIMSLTPWPIFFSCFFATKEVHKRLHGFDNTIWIMEDYDYAYRARQSGASFGIINGTFFKASDRRFKEGARRSIFQAIYAEIYRYTHGMRITKSLFDYDMGGTTVEPDTKAR